MKIKEFFYTLKVCGLRWFVWFLPFPLIIVLMQGFGSQEKLNGKYVNAVRLGNSGLWLIYSQKIQNAIRENVRKNNEFDSKFRKEELEKELAELQ